jgi:NADH-quinone oxidoreductase subunit J
MLSIHLILFLAFGAVAAAGAINLLVQRHPINAALSLIAVMAALAGEYMLLGAEFVAAVQVIVYAGAIMVLFVFVIMLLNAGAEPVPRQVSRMTRFLGILLLAGFLGVISFVIQAMLPKTQGVVFGNFTGGTAAEIGRKLFTNYLLPFEVTSVLILIAIVGAIVLARKEI